MIRSSDAVLHRLALADLADEDHVGRLAQRVLQRREPGVGIHAHLALRDDAVAVLVDVLDRVLDGDDVAVAVLVPVADHRGEGGRLARARAAHEDHEAALGHRHVLQHVGKAQLVEFRDLRGDRAQHEARAALLDEGVHPEAPDAARADGEVALVGRLELGRLLVGHDRAGELLRVHGREALLRHGRDLAVHLHRRREARGDEEVRALAGDQRPQQVVHEFQ
jgi:hypothetical protein